MLALVSQDWLQPCCSLDMMTPRSLLQRHCQRADVVRPLRHLVPVLTTARSAHTAQCVAHDQACAPMTPSLGLAESNRLAAQPRMDSSRNQLGR